MRVNKGVAALSSVAAISLLLVGCGQSKKSSNQQILRTSTDTEIDSVDPSKTTALSSFNVLNNVDEGLCV